MDRDVLYELDMEERDSLETELETTLRVLGTGDYQALSNRPSIEGNLLEGDKTFYQLGLLDITNAEIDEILFGEDDE